MKKSRRNFIKNSLLGTGGILMAPSFIGCSNDTTEDLAVDVITESNFQNFDLGVASFDPTQNSVIIWTRYSTSRPSVLLQWQISRDKDFTTILERGDVVASESNDHTAATRVTRLAENTKYYYRFIEFFSHDVSITGETQTFSQSNITQLKLGMASCSNYELGYFNVYKEMAESDIDLVIHLGDYIYENGASNNSIVTGREHLPNNELITIQNYRERYRQYRNDKDLQLLHQKKPFICVWDDHEISNDAYKDGAEGHQSDEGSYDLRKQAAQKAYREYLPSLSNGNKIYRSFKFGSLAQLTLLDTRHYGRDKQLDYANYYDAENNFDTTNFQLDINNENRSILGLEQQTWLLEQIEGSNAEWFLLGQQVLMGKMYFPAELVQQLNILATERSNTGEISSESLFDLQSKLMELVLIKNRINANDTTLTLEEKLRINTVLPYNLDAWDGYPAEREIILNALESKKTIVLTGDSHNAWHNKIQSATGQGIVNEIATASVTSVGFEGLVENESQLSSFESASMTLVDGLEYFDASKKGFVKLTLETGSAISEWISVDSIIEPETSSSISHSASI